MKLLNALQIRLLSEFFANMAVVWFAAAFVAPIDFQAELRSLINGSLSLVGALFLLKGVREL